MGIPTDSGGFEPVTRRRLATAVRLALVALLGALSLVVVAPAASAEVEEGIGHRTTPGQSWGDRDRDYDWLGSYVVDGEHVFCVSFALKAPDSTEHYEPGDELLTKWGDPLESDVAANISYLLLRYGDTTDADEAAALAHLLHSWTAAPRSPADLDPSKPFTEIGYDVEAQFAKLPQGAQDAVETLRSDAEANRGPWTANVTAPEGEQIIDAPADWTVSVTNADGTGIPGVEVDLALTDLAPGDAGDAQGDPPAEAESTGADGADGADGAAAPGSGDAGTTDENGETVTLVTDEDGNATLTAAATGEQPSVTATLTAPAERPYVRDPVTADTQRVVSTGGEQTLTAEAATTAVPAPGVVKVTKVDDETGQGIAGVPLRLTAEDETSPAVGADGEDLVDSDGEPLVVTTEGENGLVTIEDLRTPQTVCVIEVTPPQGYGDAFDPENPPSACGELHPGDTLELRISNVADEVPRTIPAGTQPTATSQSATMSGAPVSALVALGALVVAVAGLTGWVARKRLLRQR